MKLGRSLIDQARTDLLRPHTIAYERVGFLTARFAWLKDHNLLVLGFGYHPVAEDDYLDDDRYGALINSNAFRAAMQIALDQKVGLFHVHLHSHLGVPRPSGIDSRETAQFVPDFFHVRKELFHGALILSDNTLSGRIWLTPEEAVEIDEFNIIGAPLVTLRNE
jgi:hypothetical protein